jgi:hypothetical protein
VKSKDGVSDGLITRAFFHNDGHISGIKSSSEGREKHLARKMRHCSNDNMNFTLMKGTFCLNWLIKEVIAFDY